MKNAASADMSDIRIGLLATTTHLCIILSLLPMNKKNPYQNPLFSHNKVRGLFKTMKMTA
jgi:hypothetical protein